MSPTSRKHRRHVFNVARMQETFDLSLELNCEIANFYSAMAYPGSSLYKMAIERQAELPETWDLFVPEHLVDTQVRSSNVGAFAKVTSGVDWLGVNLQFSSDGIGVDRDELRRCLQEGKKYVRLEDGSFAPFDPQRVQAMLDRGVSTRRGIACAHREPAYPEGTWKCAEGDAPLAESERARDQCVILPIYHTLAREDQDYVIEELREAVALAKNPVS